MYKHIQRIHFVGIGGIGMSGIAEILLNLGYTVSGSDLKSSPVTRRLQRQGAKIRYSHRPDNIVKAQVIVKSSAINGNNPEVAAALDHGIPVIARAEMLAELMRLKYGIAVAGSHGKTTTTSLIGAILTDAGIDPTLVIGGRVRSLRSNARLGRGDYLVAEADESDGSFLHLSPTIAVVTNIDAEHMQHYKDFQELKKAFARFCARIPFYGAAILCADHPETAKLAENFPRRLWTYGVTKKADFMARKLRYQQGAMTFDVVFGGQVLGSIKLQLPGQHNVANALAAIAVAHEIGIPFSKVRRSLKNFKGIARRLEVLWKNDDLMIVDDYGHHPEEISATLEALRKAWRGYRIRTVFQPHRYTRTKELFHEFAKALSASDEVMITDIFAAGEKPIVGISGQNLAHSIGKKASVQHISDFDQITSALWETRGKKDLILTLGAGNVGSIAKTLANKAKQERKNKK